MTAPLSAARVYYVVEKNTTIEVRSVVISKASDRAFVLEETIISSPLGRPKKVLFKGVDLIALTEKEAVGHYLNQMRQQMIDMEFARVRAEQLTDCAVEALRLMNEVPPAPAELAGISTTFHSDHPASD